MTEQSYFDWTTLPFNAAEFAARRARLAARLAGDLFLTPARYHRSDGFTFRQLDDFLYFTGLELPDSVFALDGATGDALLFVPPRDPRFDSADRPNDFPGRSLLTDTALTTATGLDAIRPIAQLDAYLADQARAGRTVRLNPGYAGALRPVRTDYIQRWRPADAFLFHLRRQHPALPVASAYAAVAALRMVKSAAELTVIRRACRITIDAIVATAAHIRPGVDERTLEGILEAAFKRAGAQRLPFASIIKSGPNALWPWRILAAHYDRRNRALQAGEVVVFDVGCEVDSYISDMGRTFPVSGAFSAAQTAVLDMQRAVLDALIDAMRPGVTLAEVQAAGAAVIPRNARPHMQTGFFFGHHIGLAAGDPSVPDVPLAPGMVITVEPWYYNHATGLGTFLEDVIIVTERGAENVSVGLPRTAVGLAALVGR